jgi:uncharacterized repeat protein (TIGR03803 family)
MSCAGFVMPALAQTFNQVKSFAPTALDPSTGWYTNRDGAYPQADLISSGDTLYGVASAGGAGGAGTIFKINTNGSGFAVLTNFTATKLNPGTGQLTNRDGATPLGRLLLSDAKLYGTASAGGAFGFGTVFKINTNGSGFAVIRHFSGSTGDGASPYGGVIMPGDTLIGTTEAGGNVGEGTVFEVGTNGGGFSILHHFNSIATNGVFPRAELLRQGSAMYGTTYAGGSSGWGTVFKMNTNGGGFTLLKSFTSADSGTNSDGASPEARLILSAGMLYGTTYRGGSSNGTVFKVATNSTGFAVLKTFSPFGPPSFGQNTNADGANSVGRLVFFGGAVYGTESFGGASGAGTIFKVNTNGGNFTVLRTFAEINGFGGVPAAGLLLVGNTFYGTTRFGGEGNGGTIFSLPIPGPQLAIARLKTNAVLTWSTNDIGYTLESTPALDSSSIWSTVSPPPVIVNGENTVTNPISGKMKFYRLSQ